MTLIGFSNWMESVGWLETETKMKVKSEQNPEGFDYSNIIEVLSFSQTSSRANDDSSPVRLPSHRMRSQEAINKMKVLFPRFAQEDFLLLHSFM
jgi:hypothetical protein